MALQRTTTSPFEATFARYAGAIPQDFLRTLAYRESSLRPDQVHPKSQATGLFQITKPALAGFNAATGSKLTLANLTDPDVNTRAAVHHLTSVINTYRRHRSLAPDWTSRRWVELLTLGWNAGHNAIATLASKMEKGGLPDERITVDTVSQLARASGNGKYVADPARVTWSKSVASLFLGGGAIPSGGAPLTASILPGAGGGTAALIFTLLTAGAVLAFGRRAES